MALPDQHSHVGSIPPIAASDVIGNLPEALHQTVAGETPEEGLTREVTEETGLDVVITAPLESISYSFVRDGVRIAKTVHYFLMEPTGGDLSRHDREFHQVRWVAFDDGGVALHGNLVLV